MKQTKIHDVIELKIYLDGNDQKQSKMSVCKMVLSAMRKTKQGSKGRQGWQTKEPVKHSGPVHVAKPM